MTPPGIEPATFLFVAQHLNHCATAVPHTKRVTSKSLSIPFFRDAKLRSWMTDSRLFEAQVWSQLQHSKRQEVIRQQLCHIPESENFIGSALET